MKLFLLKNTILIALFLTNQNLYSAEESLDFKDRLIVSIKNISYSQRHIELYIYIREALREKQADITHFQPLNKLTWRDALTFFVSDVKLLQEQQRLTVYTPPKRGLNKARERINDRKKNIPEFAQRLVDLEADDESIAKILQQILSVEFYRETRTRKSLNDSSESTQETLFVRFYDGAFNFIAIRHH